MDPLTFFTQETDARRNPDPGDKVVSRSERRIVTRVEPADAYNDLVIYYYAGASWGGIVLEQKKCSLYEWRTWAWGGRIETDDE